ncbi:efflux RND transporter periplasmic adaptor subunit [Cognatiluteimonas profundi]|uniref:efflux RND transporter periplasmic adaptor subunit n=1 Tax=Cognatiluteimonas profundi TaxID=2594501 RepID=UPI001E58ADA6|nr:efflux RND transporter periplasmic adaptor subunit [Lysobacter profundi]
MRSIHLVAAAALFLLGGVGLGYWMGHSRGTTQAASVAPAQRKVLYWYDPMMPQERYAKPGKSSMNVKLIPKYAGDANDGGVAVAPGLRQSLGMRTVVVARGSLESTIHVPGSIGWDLRQERVVSARVDSIVERLYVRTPFESVHAGQPLASVLAPAWSSALAEAHALGHAQSASARDLQSAARTRLRVLGLPVGTGGGHGGSITLTSPITGVVSEIGVREGQSAPVGTLLFRINGSTTVWLEAAVPQAGLGGIATGTAVEASVDAVPGHVFRGRVEALLPQVDVGSRTQRARIVIDNPDGLLAPGMFAQVTLKPAAGTDHPLVPSDALIGAGAQSHVIVLGDDGRFHPVAVVPGRSGAGMTEVLSGLKGGERVVASGEFLLDSEANLSGGLDRLGSPTVTSDAEAGAPARGDAPAPRNSPDRQRQP